MAELNALDFGQKADLCVRIREILRNYPEGSSILKELIQNADDAGAAQLTFVLDVRRHRREQLWSSNMAELHGPALLAYNNSKFTKTDFESIQRIGASLKKETSKGVKTGRFGVGFNSVYHLTDVPQFVSDKYVVMFDPQAKFLPDINPANPGKIIDFIKSSGAVNSTYADQFHPLKAFGCDLKTPFNGTLFRLPLRTASNSRLSRQTYSPERMSEILDNFCDAAPSMLLFLKKVQKISVGIWKDGMAAPNVYYSANVMKLSKQVAQARGFVTTAVAAATLAAATKDAEGIAQVKTVDYQLKIQSTWHNDGKLTVKKGDAPKRQFPNTIVESWYICNQLGGGRSHLLATHPDNLHLKLVPWAGAAARMSCEDNSGNVLDQVALSGQVYCFLPLPVFSGLPVHMNGYFELSSNRRDIWSGSDMAGEGALRAQWNQSLLEDVIVPCYCRLLKFAQSTAGVAPGDAALKAYYSLFPMQKLTSPMWQNAVAAFFQSIRESPLFFTAVNGGGWRSAATGILPHEKCTESDRLRLESLFHGISSVCLLNGVPMPLARLLLEYNVGKFVLDPPTTRRILRQKAVQDLASKLKKREDAAFLLDYCLSDLDFQSYYHIEGTRLLPLKDGSYGAFSRRIDIVPDDKALEQLSQMGFPFQVCCSALRKYRNNLEQASVWLLGLQDNRGVGVQAYQAEAWELSPYFLCSPEETNVLAGVALHAVVDVGSCTPRTAQILSSELFHKALNVEQMSSKSMSQLLPDVLPPEWRNSPYVEWTPSEENASWAGKAPPTQWVQNFWKYAHGTLNSDLKLFENKCPLVPTKDRKLYMIKRALPILLLSQEESEDAIPVISVLRNIGVDFADISLLGGYENASRLVPRYFQKPKRSGILEVINGVVAIKNSKYREVFSAVDDNGRESMRLFLSSESVERLAKRECLIISRLPVYQHYANGVNATPAETSQGAAPVNSYGPLRKTDVFLDAKALFIHENIIPQNFVVVKSSNEKALLVKLGVPAVNELQFCLEHFLPSFPEADVADDGKVEARTETIISVLLNLPRLSRMSKHIVEMLRETNCIADDGGKLRRPNELYDREISVLNKLLSDDPTVFPGKEFSSSDILASLRVLGLRTSLSRTKIVECASSLHNNFEGSEELRLKVREKSICLLQYIDARSKELFAPPEKSLFSAFRDDSERVASIQRFRENLMDIPWVPVMSKPSGPHIPWRDGGLGLREVRLPSEVRPKDEEWLCSFSLGIVNGTVQSRELKEFFGWKKEIEPQIVALQLIRLGQHFEVNNIELNQLMSLQVPKLYRSLAISCKHDPHTMDKIKTVLNGTDWIWVGDCFVSDDCVAFSSPVNTKPYLYAVPPDLAMGFGGLFKSMGVRPDFSTADFAHVLSKVKENSGGKPLEKHDLEMSVALVQMLSDSPIKASNFDIYAPNANGIMELSTKMVFDDAPWLSKNASSATVNDSIFVCPKISNDVAKNVGVQSLRGTLIEEETEDLLSDFDASSFGQAEPLTGRLHHILELYPEGPGILSELIQNADDARATEVSIFFNSKTYGTNSLLGPQMSKWQGPALYVHNNAVFSQSDFQNLVKIGQASKLEKLSTTGRFGLGFNSVYHFTDVPSFVTGDHVVMFDPHTDYIPRATHQQPGLKLKFSGSKIIDQFQDQFAPYLFFGCNMKEYYYGTLFRFPLRSINHNSKIKSQPYSREKIMSLLNQFKANIVHSMIFLRHVKKISVYLNSEENAEPALLYEAFVSKRDDKEWSSLTNFLNPSISKEAMYGRLMRTPEDQLPKCTQKVEITSRMKNTSSGQMKTQTDDFLVAQRIGGGEARNMACNKDNSNMKLIPWGGVAAHINASRRVGRAFCFLPLPAETGLSVHVHGYFELSSDRRNIWFGDDMAGEGATRAQWNAALLRDIVAPCYQQLLLAAGQLFGPSEKDFYGLFPQQIPPGPWAILAHSFFQAIKDCPLLYSEVNGGSWITPNQAMVVKDQLLNAKGMKRLVDLLLLENIPLVQLSDSTLTQLLIEEKCVRDPLSSREVRSHFKNSGRHHPALNDRDDAMFMLDVCLLGIKTEEDYADLIGLPLIPMADGTLALFERPGARKNIFVCSRQNETKLLGIANRDLLIDPKVVGESESRRPVDLGYHSISKYLRDPIMMKYTHIRNLTPTYFASLLATMLPGDWRGKREVLWEPAEMKEGNALGASESWIRRLWWFLLECTPESDKFYKMENGFHAVEREWPLLPTAQPRARTLMSLRPKMPVINGYGLSKSLCNLFARVGVRTVDNSILSKPPKEYVQPGTVEGCLRVLYYSVEGDLTMLSDRFAVIKSESRTELREFLGKYDWEHCRKKEAALTEEERASSDFISMLGVMRALPIYEVFGGAAEFKPLSSEHYLVSDDLLAFKSMLSSRFLVTNTVREKKLLLNLGVEERAVPTAIVAEQIVHMGSTKLTPALQRKINANIIDLYSNLAEQSSTEEELAELQAILKSKKWIWIENKFLSADSVAFRCPQNAAPFLYQVPVVIREDENIKRLWSSLGVREEFEASDFVVALKKLKNTKSADEPLEKDYFDFAVALLQMLAECDSQVREVAARDFGPIYVPNEHSILRDSKHVVFNDAEWLQVGGVYEFCHSNISNTVASKIGVRSLRSIELEGRNDMKEFGCPNPTLINSLLGSYTERQRIFSDVLEFAEENRGLSVSFCFDDREYPSQSIMHQNMLPLQKSKALCAVLENVTIDSNQVMDALSVRTAAERGRIGINSLYHLSDCLEVLSGDYLYVIDPTCEYTKSTTYADDESATDDSSQDGSATNEPPSSNAGRVKAYKWYNTNLGDRFPDAFQSFLSLDSKFDLRSKFNGTIIRAPFRSESSNVSEHIPLHNDVQFLTEAFVKLTPVACLFTAHVEAVEILQTSAEKLKLLCGVKVKDPEAVRPNRQKLSLNDDWHQQNFTRFFTGWRVQKMKFAVDMIVKAGGDTHKDTYEVQLVLGPGNTRDMSLSMLTANPERTKVQDVIPIIGIAAHTHRNDISPPGNDRTVGRLMRPAPLPVGTGLPCHIMGNFKLHPTGKPLSTGAYKQWNSSLFEEITGDRYVSLLKTLVQKYTTYADPRSLYKVAWPMMCHVNEDIVPFVSPTLQKQLADRPYFFSSISNNFTKLSKGCFPGKNMPPLVQDCVAKQMEIFDVPPEVADDLSAGGVYITRMGPPELRQFIRKRNWESSCTELIPTCISMLEYCIADLVDPEEAYNDGAFGEQGREGNPFAVMQGLRICPTAAGNVVRFLSGGENTESKRLILGPAKARALLPACDNMFINEFAFESEPLKCIFEDDENMRALGITPFGPRVLALHIASSLPSNWRGKLKVSWTPGLRGQPTHLWMRYFWSVVDITNSMVVELFNDYPLVPLATGELLSCSLCTSALCVDASRQHNTKLRREINLQEEKEDIEGENEEVPGEEGAEGEEAKGLLEPVRHVDTARKGVDEQKGGPDETW
jgi:hypothetical protein